LNRPQQTFEIKALAWLAACVGLLLAGTAGAKEYWVAPAPAGDDSAAGTEAAPFATLGRAETLAAAGDTVFVRGGRYAFTGAGTVGVAFTKSGSSGNPIRYFAVAGEVPIFDLGDLTPSNRVTGLDVRCNYVHIRGFEVTGVRQYMGGQDSWGVRIQGSNNVLENLNVHHNEAPGIFITSGANNRVLNCDAHDNYDVLEDGGSGDGFGCHSSGSGNVFIGCRGYDNSDDGFDFINAAGSCTVEKSFAFRNGWIPGTRTAAGNGAGFKAGGYGSPPSVPATGAARHVVRQCVAFGNRAQGFYANHHPGRIDFYNNLAFDNPVNFNMLADAGYPSSHELRNNVAMSPGTALSNLSGGTDGYNSWKLGVTVSAADFVSMDRAQAQATRQVDGSLPDTGFARLADGSDLVDQGVDVGLPFNGKAPDLGAFEAGGASSDPPGTGGAMGGSPATGGTAGRGGSSSGSSGESTGGRVNASGGTSNTSGGAPVATGGTAIASGGSSITSGGSSITSGGSSIASGGSSITSGGRAAGSGGSAGVPAPLGTSGNVSMGDGGDGMTGSSRDDDASSCTCRAPGRSRTSGAPASLVLLGIALGCVLLRRRWDAITSAR
jgi:parallel beta-helix repeat protein